MVSRPSVLCPIDFSEGSRGALRYAGTLAAHFGARLTLLAVIDELCQDTDMFAGSSHLQEDTHRELERFFARTFAGSPHGLMDVVFEVTSGKPAREILRVSAERASDVIVMSTHGLAGFRRMFFGSTTERVLRETAVPVLVTPCDDRGPARLEDVRRLVRRVLAPVDLTGATRHQLRIGRGIAQALQIPLVVLHVAEPVPPATGTQRAAHGAEAEYPYRAERKLEAALEGVPDAPRCEPLVAYGEPAEEIAKVAGDRDAGLIVMGLHSSLPLGPRMGSVTYRVLCLARRLVLALPPVPAAARAPGRRDEPAAMHQEIPGPAARYR